MFRCIWGYDLLNANVRLLSVREISILEQQYKRLLMEVRTNKITFPMYHWPALFGGLPSFLDMWQLLNTFSIGPSGDLERKFKSENIGTEVQKKLRSQRCGLLSEKEVGKHRLSIEWTLLIVVHLSACQRNKYFRKGHSPHRIQCFFRFFSAQTCVIFLKRTNLQKNSAQRCVSLLIGHSWFVVPLSAFQRNKYLRRDTLAEGLFGEKCRMNRDFLFYSWEQPFLFCNLY